MDPATFLHGALAAVGLIIVLKYVENVLSYFYCHFIRPSKDIKRRFGLWTVVTGATDGIGKAMAFEFARKGLKVVLISRNKEKLEQCSAELIKKYPTAEVKILDVDYGNFDAPARARVADFLKELDIGVLVNNVGISYPFTKYFHELDDQTVEQLTKINIDSTTWMTRVVLPGMLNRKRGSIVNIGSAAGVSTSPLLAQYGAAKSYVAMFSKALEFELRGKGVHVQCQVPMFVATKLARIKSASLFVASPSGYARAAVAAIGYESLLSPFWSHAIQIWVLTEFPEWLMARVTNSMHHAIRIKGEQTVIPKGKILSSFYTGMKRDKNAAAAAADKKDT